MCLIGKFHDCRCDHFPVVLPTNKHGYKRRSKVTNTCGQKLSAVQVYDQGNNQSLRGHYPPCVHTASNTVLKIG